MSYKLWFKRYSLDPSIVGKSFVLNGVPTTLVGIMPLRFDAVPASGIPFPSVIVEVTPEGLRIQLVDQEGRAHRDGGAGQDPVTRGPGEIVTSRFR